MELKDNTGTVTDLFLSATNEGAMYPTFKRLAYQAIHPARYNVTPAGSATAWLNAARAYYTRHYRGSERSVSAYQWLMFAAALADYYGDHLGEFDDGELEGCRELADNHMTRGNDPTVILRDEGKA